MSTKNKKPRVKDGDRFAGSGDFALTSGKFALRLGSDTRLPILETVGPPSEGEALQMLCRSLATGELLCAEVKKCHVSVDKKGKRSFVLMASYGPYTVGVALPEFTQDNVAAMWRRAERSSKYKSVDAFTEGYIRSRLGAEIDFVVTDIDEKRRLVKASRLRAMKSKRAYYWFGTSRGGYYIESGALLQARVAAVDKGGVLAEIFGAETYIPLSELDFGEVDDARALYRPGDTVNVRLKSVTRGDNYSVRAAASVKNAESDWRCENVMCLKTETEHEGAVEYAVAPSFDSEKATGTVFVKLRHSGVLVMCPYPKNGKRISHGMGVEVRLDSVQPAKKCFYGVIVGSGKKARASRVKKRGEAE